jgi:hypothetical protein
MTFPNSRKISRSAKTSLIIFLSSCTHIYTPEESAERIKFLENKTQVLERLYKGAESDLTKCAEHLKSCQPLISDPDAQ